MASFAKITCPSPEGIFLRKRLFRIFDNSHLKSFIFVSGPPGSGKTSLVTSYLKERKLPCLWYQMDERDADVATFFYYMGHAAKKAAPRYKRPLPMLTPEYGFDVPTFTRTYFENLCSRLKPPYLLVFDNYQEIPSESFMHEIIRLGISTLPEGIASVIISRSEPPSAFTSLQAANKLKVIGWNELKLTPEESKGIANLQDLGRQESKFYEWLHEKADGWAAGLILLAHALKSHGMDPGTLKHLAPEKVFDYFANELFARFDKAMQDFLLKTAVMPKITPQWAEELTGNKSSGRILSTLNQRNYFTEKRIQPEVIYQYHALFREFLVSHAASRFRSDELSGLQIEAAKLLESSGQTEDATELLIQAGDWKRLMSLIVANAQSLISQGRNKLLEKWITAVPDDLLKPNPWLNFWLAASRLGSSPAQSRTLFDRAFQLFVSLKDDAGALLAWSGAVQTFLYEFDDFSPLDRWIAWLDERTEKGVPFPSPEIELSVAAGMMGALTWRAPGHGDLREWANKAVSLSKGSPNIDVRLRAYINSAIYHIWMGTFDECRLLIGEMKRMVESQPVSPLRSIVLKHTEAMFYNTSAEFQGQGLRSVSEGLEAARRTGVHVLDPLLYNQGIVGCLNDGNHGGSEEFLFKLEKTLTGRSRTHTSHYYYLSGCHHLSVGNLSQALFSANKALDLIPEIGVPFSEVLVRQLLTHVLSESGDEEGALRELAASKRAVAETGSTYFQYLNSLTEAYLEYIRKNESSALECLRHAMALGRQNGFTSLLYFWRHRVMSYLCEKALQAGVEVHYVQNLIRKLKLFPHAPARHVETWPWPLKIFTLGRFQIVRNGTPVQYPVRAPRVPLMLLKAIVAFGREGVREDRLIDTLWPETDADTAHQAFKTTLHRLRQLIGDEKAIQVREGWVTLDQRRCWVDAYAFETLLEETDPLWKKSKTEKDSFRKAVELAENALSFYRGAFLGEEANESWIISYQERLRSKFIRAISQLGDHFEGTKQWERAIEWYQRGLEVDPLAEDFYQRLIACYHSSDRRAEGAATYHRCKKILQSTLGVDPSPKTEQIFNLLERKIN
jgi:LuxR family transcriptional regulator, maltose regulon positive regulatory protein